MKSENSRWQTIMPAMTERFSAGCRLSAFALMALCLLPCVEAQQPPASSTTNSRTEKDLLGEKEIPADAYYGVQTARALENFQLSGVVINHYPGFVEAWAIVKLAAAQANTDVGAMKPERLAAIRESLRRCSCGQVSRPISGRLVPGRRRHLDEYECQ